MAASLKSVKNNLAWVMVTMVVGCTLGLIKMNVNDMPVFANDRGVSRIKMISAQPPPSDNVKTVDTSAIDKSTDTHITAKSKSEVKIETPVKSPAHEANKTTHTASPNVQITAKKEKPSPNKVEATLSKTVPYSTPIPKVQIPSKKVNLPQTKDEAIVAKPTPPTSIPVLQTASKKGNITERKRAPVYKHLPVLVSNTNGDDVIPDMTSTGQGKYLVYLCDSTSSCGGWGDRQRMFTSMLYFAEVTGRQFRLIMNTPCNITKFYRPNRYQWIPVEGELRTDSNITLNLLRNKNHSAEFHGALRNGDFNVKYPQKVVYLMGTNIFFNNLMGNKLYAPALRQWKNRDQAFRWAWQELMAPSEYLLQSLESVVGADLLIRRGLITQSVLPALIQTSKSKPNASSQLTCSHVRVGNNPSNPRDNSLNRFRVESIPDLMKNMSNTDVKGNTRFYLATDSDEMRGQFSSYFGARLMPPVGTITHIDRQRGSNAACEGFGVAMLEQLILSVCDYLVLTPSGFSYYGALTSNTTHPIYTLAGPDGKFLRLEY